MLLAQLCIGRNVFEPQRWGDDAVQARLHYQAHVRAGIVCHGDFTGAVWDWDADQLGVNALSPERWPLVCFVPLLLQYWNGDFLSTFQVWSGMYIRNIQ